MQESKDYDYSIDYTKSQDKAIQQLVNELLDYSNVKISINSRNVYKNL